MTTCLTHVSFPDLKNCNKCRKEYKEVMDRWLKEKEVIPIYDKSKENNN